VIAALSGYIESFAKKIPSEMAAQFDILISRLQEASAIESGKIAANAEALRALNEASLTAGVVSAAHSIAGKKASTQRAIGWCAGLLGAALIFWGGWYCGVRFAHVNVDPPASAKEMAALSQAIRNANDLAAIAKYNIPMPDIQRAIAALQKLSADDMAAAVEIVRNGNELDWFIHPEKYKALHVSYDKGRKYIDGMFVWLQPPK
jgi:hypothetical protein